MFMVILCKILLQTYCHPLLPSAIKKNLSFDHSIQHTFNIVYLHGMTFSKYSTPASENLPHTFSVKVSLNVQSSVNSYYAELLSLQNI